MEFSPFLATITGNVIIAAGIIIAVFIASFIKKSLSNYLEYVTATTVGLMLGIIFLGFFPELSGESNLVGIDLGIFILIGLFLFYMLELFLHWHHCKDLSHDNGCGHSHSDEHKSSFLMFGGTFLHNAFHGIVLFSAFAVDFHFGIATVIAVLLHSIPQNIVNYIMNHNKMKYVYIAAFGGVFGGLATYFFSDFLIANKFYLLAIITGGLLYTALADIFPEFKGKGETSQKLLYLVFIVIGIFIFLGFESLSGHEHSHEEEEIHIEEHVENDVHGDENEDESI